MARLFSNHLLATLMASFSMTVPAFANLDDRDRGSCHDEEKYHGEKYNKDYFEENYRSDGAFGTDGGGAATRVLMADAPVYADWQGAQTSSRRAEVSFGDKLYMIEERGDRIQIRESNLAAPLGWIDKRHLLCHNEPLFNIKTNSERKAYIRTDSHRVNPDNPLRDYAIVKAYENASLNHCDAKKDCAKLSRFAFYFIVAQSGDAVLLTEYYKPLNDNAALVGWVDTDDIIPWDTAIGLRPRDDIKAPDGTDGAVCLYSEKEHIGQDDKCNPLLGGNRWYKQITRLPVIDYDTNKGIYTVAAPYNREGQVVAERIDNNPGRIIFNLNRVDVFFLIDGTESMAPWIKAIVGDGTKSGIVPQIKENLKGKLSEGAQIRFGFRVFKDTTKEDEEGLGKHMDFGAVSDCQRVSEADIEKNHLNFPEELASVEATEVRVDDGKRDDYPENLFGGIEQAVLDVRDCPAYTKLIFVIGDAAYDSEAQRRRGITPVDIKDLTAYLDSLDNGLIFFIRTPKYLNNDPYNNAWNEYRNQAIELIGKLKLVKEIQISSSSFKPEDFFFQLPENTSPGESISLSQSQSMLDNIIKQIDKFVNPRQIKKVAMDIRGGAAVTEAAERAQGDDPLAIPVAMIKRATDCDNSKQKCDTRTFEEVGYFYLSDEDEGRLTQDIFIDSNDLNELIASLSKVANRNRTSGMNQTRKREFVARVHSETVEKVLGTDIQETGDSPHDFFKTRKDAIPARLRGPFFAYSYNELTAGNEIEDCEINLLLEWLETSHDALREVYDLYKKPVWLTEDYGSLGCSLSDRGEKIPYAPSGVSRNLERLGEDDDYSYCHKLYGKLDICWVPRKFLP